MFCTISHLTNQNFKRGKLSFKFDIFKLSVEKLSNLLPTETKNKDATATNIECKGFIVILLLYEKSFS